MSDDRDDDTKAGLVVVFATVALVVAGVLGYAVVRTLNAGKAPAAPAAAAAPAAVPAPAPEVAASAAAPVVSSLADAPLTSAPDGVLYFDSGKADLPADAAGIVDGVLKLAAASPATKIVLSGFHDETGDPAFNAELAKSRAKAVRAALVAGGVAEDRVILRKPEVTTGTGSNQEARRVEVRVLEGN